MEDRLSFVMWIVILMTFTALLIIDVAERDQETMCEAFIKELKENGE